MRPKHIKAILVLLFIFCCRVALASAAICTQRAPVLCIEKFNPSSQPDENEKIAALLIQSQVCEIEPQYEPVKTITYQQAALQNYGNSFNVFPPVNYIDGATSTHYSRLCRLMLFPRHGFW